MVILFDCFGVILDEIAPKWIKRYLPEEEALVVKEKIFNRADMGTISEEETFIELSKISGEDPLKIQKEWHELVKPNTELIEKIRELKKTHRIYLLSNAIGTFLHSLLKEYDLYSLFDKLYISSEIKHIKPNKDYFEYVINDLSLDPSQAVMIDDNPKNIESAKACGLNGIVFTSNTTLFEELLQ